MLKCNLLRLIGCPTLLQNGQCRAKVAQWTFQFNSPKRIGKRIYSNPHTTHHTSFKKHAHPSHPQHTSVTSPSYSPFLKLIGMMKWTVLAGSSDSNYINENGNNDAELLLPSPRSRHSGSVVLVPRRMLRFNSNRSDNSSSSSGSCNCSYCQAAATTLTTATTTAMPRTFNNSTRVQREIVLDGEIIRSVRSEVTTANRHQLAFFVYPVLDAYVLWLCQYVYALVTKHRLLLS